MQEHSGFEPVNGADAAWLRLDRPGNRVVITTLAIVDPLDPGDFRELLRTRFLAFPRFRQRPVSHSGLYFWEDDPDFDLDAHVRIWTLPEPGDKAALEAGLSQLLAEPLDPLRPLWQFLLVPEFEGGTAVILRVHHCYADGLSLVAVFGVLTDGAPDVGKDWALPTEREVRARGRLRRMLGHVVLASERSSRLRYRLQDAEASGVDGVSPRPVPEFWQSGLGGVAEMARIAALPADPETALRRAPGADKVCAWSAKIPLDDFKVISRQLGCSVNDVLVSVVSAGLRRLLARQHTVDPGLRLHATLPVNLRPLENGLSDHGLGNQIGTVFVPLAVGLQNPLERLYKTKHDMLSLKHSSLPALSHWLMGVAGLLPRGWQEPILDLFSNKTSLVLSNVPGSRQRRYLAGRRVRELMFWVPQAGDLCLGISLLSYAGDVQIGVNADRQILARPAELIDDMLQELDIYRQLAQSPYFCQVHQRP